MWDKTGLILLLSAAAMAGCESGVAFPKYAPRPAVLASFDEAVADVAALRYSEATEKFSRILPHLETAGMRRHAAEAMFWLGYCAEKQQRNDQARIFYEGLVARYGRTPAARQARERLSLLPPPPGP